MAQSKSKSKKNYKTIINIRMSNILRKQAASFRTKHICPLPWHHFYFNSSGRIKACCIAKEDHPPVSNKKKTVTEFINENRNHPHLVEVRESWMSGVVPSTCRSCIKSGGLKKIMRTTKELQHLEPCNTSKVDFPARHIDYRYDKTCQAGCIMCSPYHSSRWASVVKNNPKYNKWLKPHPQIQYEVDYKWIYEVDEIVYLCIAGGEPLLTDRNYDFLYDNIHKIQRLMFISNINNISEQIFKLFENHKSKIRVTISCDGLRDVYNLHRGGLNWEQFEKNYQRLLKIWPHHLIKINTVLTKYNEHQIEDLKKYFKGHHIDFIKLNFGDHIYDPEFLELYKSTFNV